jgi:hypothetical protein
LHLTFSNETINVERAQLILKDINGEEQYIPIEKPETKSKCTLEKTGTSYTMTLSEIENDETVFQLIAINITKTKDENKAENENESGTVGQTEDEQTEDGKTEYETYIVSNPSLICVNCNFCLDENSANIFLTRVDFDKEEPEDKKKLFRQYISLPIKTNYLDFAQFNETSQNNAIYGVSTDGVKATLDNCVIQNHGGKDKFFDCNLAKNKQFKGEGGKDDDHAREFIIHFNVTDDFTIATKYELHLVKGEFLSLSFTLLFLFLGILF